MMVRVKTVGQGARYGEPVYPGMGLGSSWDRLIPGEDFTTGAVLNASI
jgi:hypothetical protein